MTWRIDIIQRMLTRVIPYLPQRFRQGRMLYVFLFVVFIVGVLLLYTAITPYPNERGLYLTLAVSLIGLIVRVNQRRLSLIWAVHLGTSAGALMLVWMIGASGGIFSPQFAWLLVLPLTPFYVIGHRAGLFWFAVVLAIQLGMGLLSYLQWLPIDALGELYALSSYITISMATVVLVVVPIIYERMHQAALAQIWADQQELERRREALERASQARSQFIAAVSHELRTPMNAILGFNALLLSRVQDQPAAVKVLRHTRQSADHLMTVINDILDYSQLKTGHLVVQPEVFALRETVVHAFELFTPRVNRATLDYRIELDPALPRWVHSDRHRLMQILVNLLGNAIKFTPTGSVVLHVQWQNPGVLFVVQDTGIGIPKEQHARIFHRFTQADADIQSRYGGNGLGLAISQKLVHLLGGDIGFESAPGIGSRFWFCLPLQASDPPDRAPAGGENARLPMQTAATAWHFLLVDDHRVNRLLVRQVLQDAWPHAVILEASNGQQCLELLAQQKVDLVVMDMVMPVMNGIEATRRLRQNPAWQRLPMLGLTANGNPVDLAAFKAAGLDEVMLKPFELDRLCAAVEQLLLQRQ